MPDNLAGTPPAEAETALKLSPVPLRLKTILVPTDFSESSYRALNHAMGLAEQFGSSLRIVHVVEPVYPYPIDGIMGYPGDAPADSLYDSGADAEATLKRLHNAVRAATERVSSETALRVGRAYQQIVNAAREYEADLIVIATHGYSGLKHAFLGSTAERVVRHAPCPVLVLRSHSEPPPTE